MDEGEEVVGEESIDGKEASARHASESPRMSRSKLKTMIMGVGVILILIGASLAVYVAVYEDEPFLIALAPAFLGVIVIVAGLLGKRR